MNIQRAIFAAVVAIVFLFAGYNLYNYFSNQAEIQAQKELEAQRAATERERRKAAQAEARQQAEAERLRKQQEQRLAEQKAEEEAKRLKEAEEREVKRQRQIAREQEREAQRLQERIKLARTPKHIEGLPPEAIEKFTSVAARYIRDNPAEFQDVIFSDKTLYPRRSGKRLLKDDTNMKHRVIGTIT